LVHNRPIVRHVDDSIVRIVLNKEMVLRRARGYAPFPINLSETKKSETVLALGGHLKNSIAIKVGHNAFISQHIGDLSTDKSYQAFTQTISDFQKLYEIEPEKIICDLHPEYLSTKYAESLNKNLTMVQHHYAHVASCRAENQVSGRALGVSWDGTGFGFDGTIWGGEFFISNDNSFEHIGQLRQFPLPGGERAVKEGRRSALGILFEIFGDEIFDKDDLLIRSNFSIGELKILKEMLNKKFNTPKTSSAGRLFDAVSSLLNISQQANYEGQSAMKLEFAVDQKENRDYQFAIHEGDKLIVDWEEIISSILQDKKREIEIEKIAAKFHNTLAKIILSVAELVGEEKIILSGGCFQNVCLTEKTVELLSENGYKIYLHQRVPPNDGGLSLGQIAAANVKHDKRKMNFRKRELQGI
ncbi:MAG: carbamoyltransferase HypF, partial [Melioribacteraceae bacterium]|nr:carbamoyltransferase HypF [Melioribacteraceae bacterium]